MTSLSALFESIGLVDCAVLKQSKNNTFTVVHTTDLWFSLLFPGVKSGDELNIDDRSEYIRDFVVDAKSYWQTPSPSQPLYSGLWTEDVIDPATNQSVHLRLECIAAASADQRFLIIKNAENEYTQRQNTLQVAREMLLSHDKMQAQHDYLSQKLQTVIKRNASVLDLHLPVEQAIQNADIGVIIVDHHQHTLFSNSASFSYFELNAVSTDASPFRLVKQLLEGQYPESATLFESKQAWNGELYWHCPPASHKWLQVSIQPVMSRAKSITHWIITLSDTTRLKYLLQKNEDLVLKDALTDLPNRQFLWKFLDSSTQTELPLTLMIVDIRKFKRINDLYGHSTGDKILKDLATRLRAFTNSQCYVARIGSARFALIQQPEQDIQLDEQRALAESLYEKLSERLSLPFITEQQISCQLDISVGVALFPADADNAESLVKAADMALSATEHNSENHLQFYSIALSEASKQRLLMEVKLKQAVENEDFRIMLQPILDTESERVVKAEALLRWTTPEGESIPPDVFIPIAEQTGLIIPLGNWVIEHVCRLLSFMRDKQIGIKLSINISPKQVSDRYLYDFIQTTARQSGVDAHKLELELTEGVLINDYDKASALLNALRNMGVSIAIDDFGTGYSSLSYLKHLPIDYLKIDRSFVRDLDLDDDDRAIVLAIIAMAKQLKLSVIAEGVETDAQKNFLKAHHCQAVQGFYYSKPLTADEFFEFYKHKNTKTPS